MNKQIIIDAWHYDGTILHVTVSGIKNNINTIKAFSMLPNIRLTIKAA
jgi:hypothetical protein